MKMLKSIISLIMAFTLIFTVSVTADERTYDYTEEMNFLTKLGVEDINPGLVNSPLTRQEAAIFLASAINADTSGAYKIFTDVSEANPAFGAVWYLHSIGAVSNSQDALYRALDYITYHEFVKMACVILGYETYANIRGGYPYGYVASASEAGILGKINSDSVFSKGEAFSIIYKMLFANKLNTDGVKFDENGEASSVTFGKGKYLIADAYKLTIHTGILRASNYASIYGPVAPSEDTVIIDSTSYKSIVTPELDEIGRKVDYYLTEDNIVYLIMPHEATVHTITSESILPVTTAYQVQYRDENKKTKKINISSQAYYMYNARPLSGPTDTAMKPAYGRLELIDWNNDRNIDVVKIWDYKSYYIKDMSAENIYFEDNIHNVEFIKYKNTNKTVTVFNRFMERISEELILPGMILTVAEASDNLILILSDNLFIGTLEAINKDGKAVIDGLEYDFIDGLDLSNCYGLKLKYYLDANETIAWTNYESDEEYAILYGISKSGSFGATVQIQLFDKGYFDIYDLTDKVRFSNDGGATFSSLDHDALYTALVPNASTGLEKRLVLFGKKAGKINKIILPRETALPNEDEFRLNLNKGDSVSYYMGYRQMMVETNGPSYMWSNSGTLLYLISDDQDECVYSTMGGRFAETTAPTYTGVKGYNLTEAGYFKFITVDMDSGASTGGNIEKIGEGASVACVTGRATILDIDGEPMEVVNVYHNNTSLRDPASIRQLSPKNTNLKSTGRAITTGDTRYIDTATANNAVSWDELKAGDIIQYKVDTFSGRVSAFCLLARASDLEVDYQDGNLTAQTRNDAVLCGTISVKDPLAIKLSSSAISHGFYGTALPLMMDTTISTTTSFDKVYVYNKDAESFTPVAPNALYEGARIWCYMRDKFYQYGLVIVIVE